MQLPVASGRTPKSDRAEGQTLLTRDPALRRPIRQEADERERRRDREALKVCRLALGILGDQCDRRVEASEAGEPTTDETRKHDRVEVRPEADDKGEQRGCDAKRDLYIYRPVRARVVRRRKQPRKLMRRNRAQVNRGGGRW